MPLQETFLIESYNRFPFHRLPAQESSDIKENECLSHALDRDVAKQGHVTVLKITLVVLKRGENTTQDLIYSLLLDFNGNLVYNLKKGKQQSTLQHSSTSPPPNTSCLLTLRDTNIKKKALHFLKFLTSYSEHGY